MQHFIGTSLKTRLNLLVLAAFIPVAMLIFFVAEEQRELETAAILQKTEVLARATANEENQQLESARTLLSAVADAYLMAGDNGDGFTGFLSNLLDQSKTYADLGIIDSQGRRLAGGEANRIGEDYSDRVWFTAGLESGALTIGPYRGEHIGGEPVLYVALPALDAGKRIRAVVFAALDLNLMNQAIFKRLEELPKGSRLNLLEESSGMLRYEVDSGQWSVPDSFDPALRRRIVRQDSGTLSTPDEDGVMRIFAFAHMTSTLRNRRVSVVLEIPQAVALAASKRTFARNVALLAVSALMALLFIWWAGDVFIIKRARAMVLASRRLAEGDLSARIGKIGVRDELSHLAGVFDEMAASLQTRIQREEEVMASLEKSREQLRRLAAHQQEVREQERIRIAREIHDQFGQSLTILKMDLSWLRKRSEDPESATVEKMDAMSEVIDEALKNLHAVTAELRPVMLDDFGLAAAIEWQVEEFRNRSGIDCRMETTGFEPDLPKDQATAVFRIFQETLTNIMRHARADKVVVRLEARGEDLVLEVRDNGRGITDADIDNPKSFGLLGIRERLYPWNGRVSFEGTPGRGTCVTVRLPMSMKGTSP